MLLVLFNRYSSSDLVEIITLLPVGVLSIAIRVFVSVATCVSLLECISQKPKVETLPNFLCLLHAAVAQSCYSGVAIRGSLRRVQPPSECFLSGTGDGFIAVSATSAKKWVLARGFLLVFRSSRSPF